ncbi:hypothetical protein DY000_02023756 [Brassica cretica]|uniref:Uncharacterized protein n=1 Tax=Brassica cretica TaxID=69181 RepID=A0ABQ7E7E0_BRACR|nr:hypothetical protein DY000_02023756 [Brassica cretica]
MTVQPIDGWRFFVKGGKMDCVVDMEHGKCDCGVLHISTLVCPVYSKDFMFARYSENIYPCVGQHVEEQKKSRCSSGCKAWSGKTEEIKMAILVGAIEDERTQTPEATHEDLQLSRPVSRPGFFLPEDLQVSRPVFSLPEDFQLSRPEGRPVSRPGFFLPEDLQVSRSVFSLPEDLQLSRPEGRPVSRPDFSFFQKTFKLVVQCLVFQKTFN